MHVIDVRNVNDALPEGIRYLQQHGVKRDSRNGPVIVAPGPVSTVYRNPMERVILSPTRDANPFFHAYEALWMLTGRNDVAGPAHILKSFAQFSDDGKTFHGAYGKRWRSHFPLGVDQNPLPREVLPLDQLPPIIEALKRNHDDRRCVLQMWDPSVDLGRVGKDVPCNQSAVFMINDGRLDMTVFCRSNDMIWGAYGANAVHFSFLLEYMALKIGVPPGVYTQVSVNFHAYDNDLWARVVNGPQLTENPYHSYDSDTWFYFDEKDKPKALKWVPMSPRVDEVIPHLLKLASLDDEAIGDTFDWRDLGDPHDEWTQMMAHIFAVHAFFKGGDDPEDRGGNFDGIDDEIDWVTACQEWMQRRRDARVARGERW